MEESQGSSLDDEELARLEESARPSSTTAATKSGIRKFEDWLQRRGKSCDYASISSGSWTEWFAPEILRWSEEL